MEKEIFYLKKDDVKENEWFLQSMFKCDSLEEGIERLFAINKNYPKYYENTFIVNSITKNRVNINEYRKNKILP
jgi:hypothetical protein